MPLRPLARASEHSLLAFLFSSVLSLYVVAQDKPATPKVTATGTCAISHSGNNDVITIKNCGIGREQADKIVEMLKAALADGVVRDAKIDELLKIARTSPSAYALHCEGSACAQGPGSQATFNQLGPPPPNVTLRTQNVTGNKTNVIFSVDGTPRTPAFMAQCDNPCESLAAYVSGGTTYTDDSVSYTTATPTVVVVLMTPHRTIGPGVEIYWVIQSKNGTPVKITSVNLLSEQDASKLPLPQRK